MNNYTIELLDIRDNVFFSTVALAPDIIIAIEHAKEKAYHQIDKHKIVIRYVSVIGEKEHYVYNMLTKKLEKWG